MSASFSSAAPRFDAGQQPLGSLAPLSLTNTDLSDGNVTAYRTWFENGSWQGDVIEYEVSPLGVLSTGIDLSGFTPEDTGGPPNTWSASVRFASGEAANTIYWDTGREIITRNGLNQVAFRWSNLSDAQKTALDQVAFDGAATSSDILDFVRGDRTAEHPDGGLRHRTSVLGDLIHSNPVYVAKPKAGFTTDGYADFASAPQNANRAPRIYVGANDGMLHALDANTGSEAWAYIPSMLMPSLNQLVGRPYSHQYYVDGSLTVQDAFFGGDWHTILVGGLGAGGKGWFGLDITNPSITDEAISAGNNAKILWELDTSNTDVGDDLGDAFGQAVIAKLNDGNWYAVLGNGYNSVNGLAKLFLVNVATGNVRSISTGSGSAASPNGLSSPTLVDTNLNGTADIVFAGDIDGNMWKFDLTSNAAGSWEVAYSGKPIHPGNAAQPIIQAPDVTLHPAAGHLVLFGTGRLFTAADLVDGSVQALYGVWDSGNVPPTAANQSLLAQTLSGDQEYSAGAITETVQTFDPDPGVIDWSSHDGWKVELPAGFRLLQPPQLRAGRLKVTIHRPFTRANFLLEAHFLDGGSPGLAIFDLDRSGELNTADNIDSNSDGDLGDSEDVAAMWQRPAGIMSQPTIARIADGVDTQLLNYLVPPAKLPCSLDCPGGFQAGHIDVDTDYYNDPNGGTGGFTYKHTHRYDKQTERVYVDYLDLLVSGHVELDNDSFIAGTREFIIVVANADLSPGSTLTLGDIAYNVVEYQALIHRKLRDWDGLGDLTDDAGNSLIFTADGLVASGGTVRNSFDDMGILGGGIHASNTGCIIGADNVTNGRYRNGALVTQAISRNIFTGGGNMLDKLIVQAPTDLQSPITLSDGTPVELQEDFDSSGSFDASAPNYEVFGGLRADISGPGDADGLFESTLFWHYQGAYCYGAPEWALEVAEKIDALILTQDEFDEMLLEASVTDLAAELLAAEECKDISEICSVRFETLQALADLEETIFNDGQIVSNTGLESDGDAPIIIDGGANEQGIISGPNFRAGRRTWVDIVAD
ncbi:MAG: PilC/PilY family type IV pilus protein [Gammaproteobacteria bacterium]|nr:PilC/PilY family type IV pilus protein [Gammaproteobacteria bacterium]